MLLASAKHGEKQIMTLTILLMDTMFIIKLERNGVRKADTLGVLQFLLKAILFNIFQLREFLTNLKIV